MSITLDSFQASQATKIANRNTIADELRNKLQDAQKKEEELKLAQRSGDPDVASLLIQYDNLLSDANDLRDELAQIEAGIYSEANDFYTVSGPSFTEVVESLSSESPILFLPVRLETKFRGSEDNRTLDIRIFPDDLMVQTHEHQLTDIEVESGKTFWNSVWDDGTNSPTGQQKIDAWGILVKTYGHERAAWIRKQCTPTGTTGAPATFPGFTTIADTWTEQAFTRVLPDRFIVVAYPNDVNGHQLSPIVTLGRPIPEKVKIGVSPNFDEEGIHSNDNNEIIADNESRWLIDFDQDPDYSAVSVGLGIKMSIFSHYIDDPDENPIKADEGFSRIFVWGIKSSLNENDAQSLIEDLIDSHHYTEGLSILKQGTSTKNSEKERSGYTSYELDPAKGYAIECGADLFPLIENDMYKQDGQRLAEALGISYDKLYHIENSDGRDIRNAMISNDALWAGSIGFYMEDLMYPLFSLEEVQQVREFYTKFVSARGIIPSIRIGTQPYGILPVSSIKDITWDTIIEPNQEFYESYNTFFDKINQYWKANVSTPSSSNSNPEQPVDNMLKTLGRNALTIERFVRASAGPEVVWNSMTFENRHDEAENWYNDKIQEAEQVLSDMGFSPDVVPDILKYSFATNQIKSKIKLVADRVSRNELDKIGESNENYINWLLNSNLDDLIYENFSRLGVTEPPKSLHYKMLRHSLLTEYWNFAADLLELSQEERKLTEFFNDGTDVPGGTPPQNGALTIGKNRIKYFDEEYPRESGIPISQIINERGYETRSPEGDNIVRVREELEMLAQVSSQELEILMNEHLDVNTHRLDAWRYGPVHQRLKFLRNTLDNTPTIDRKTGTHIGAYGWLMNVKDEVSPGNQQGNKYMLAPSINQAVMAALIKNGYNLANNFEEKEMCAVNLSSERVREALFIIDGIAKGNSLSGLLGYQFEKGLINNYELVGYIDDIRALFPYSEITEHEAIVDSSELRARMVVDGLALIRKYVGPIPGLTSPTFEGVFGEVLNTEIPPNLQQPIMDSVMRISAILDAVGDLVVAEGIFQIVQSNYDRANAASGAFSRGKRTVVPEVVDIKRRGYGITNKVLVYMAVKSWEELMNVYGLTRTYELSVRQKADPSLDYWIRDIIGHNTISNTICKVDYKTDGGVQTCNVSLSDLNLYPIDCLYIIGSKVLDSELKERIVRHIKTISTNPVVSDIEIDFMYKESNFFSVYELQGLLKHLYKVIIQSNYLKTSDYSWNLDSTEEYFDVDNIRLQIKSISDEYLAMQELLNNCQTNHPNPINPWLDALFSLSQYGVPNTLRHAKNINNVVVDQNALESDTQFVLDYIAPQLAKISELQNKMYNTSLSNIEQTDAAIELAQLIFGKDFKIFPHYKLSSAATYGISKSLETGSPLLNSAISSIEEKAIAMEEWTQDAGKVRENISRFETVNLLKDCFGSGCNLDLIPAQLPYDPIDNGIDNNRWMGLKVDQNKMKDGKLCLAMNVYDGFLDDVQSEEYLCGFIVDEWTEIIPFKEHSAAVAINFNQPNSQPPQCMLLAVPSKQPNPSNPGSLKWKQNDIQATLEQTLDDAIDRSIDYEAIKDTDLGKFIPLTIYPVSGPGTTSMGFDPQDF